MATLFEVLYRTQSNGTAATTGNTGLDTVSGTNTYSEDIAGLGTGVKTMTTATQGTLRKNLTARNNIRARWFVELPGAPASNASHTDLRSASTVRAQVRVDTNRAFRLINALTATGSASSVIPVDTPVRLEWVVNGTAGTQTLYIFIGSNAHGNTPDETLSGTYTDATFDNASVAQSTNVAGFTLHSAEWKATDTLSTMIGGTVSSEPPVASYTRVNIVEVDATGSTAPTTLTQTDGDTAVIIETEVDVWRIELPVTFTEDLVFELEAVDGALSDTEVITVTPGAGTIVQSGPKVRVAGVYV